LVRGLAAKIEKGEDLTPFLSDRIGRFGYVRQKVKKGKRRGIEWGDKDYALNCYEMHHLHLKPKRTRELLFVSFSRRDAFVLMVGDHNSFDDGTLARAIAESRVGTAYELKGILGSEFPGREQNSLQRRGFTTAATIGEHTVLGALLSGAGTSPLHTKHADRVMNELGRLDPQLDAKGFGRDWFQQTGNAYPSSPVWEWIPWYCDFCLVETTTGICSPIVKWRR